MENNKHNKKTISGPKKTGSVFDVQRPGKAAASSTSKPVIVGHKSLVQDPMMTDKDNKRPLMGHAKEVLAPSPAPVPAEAVPEAPQPNPAVSEPVAALSPMPVANPLPEKPIEPAATPVTTPEPSPATQPPPEPTPPSPQPVSEQIATPTEAPQKPIKPLPKEAFEAIAHDEHRPVDNEGAVISSQAVVSHHRRHWSIGQVILILVLIIVIAIVGVDLLIDAGLLNTTLPSTDFIS